MKQFKFEITLTDEDLMGDEFWETALKRDGTGIAVLQEILQQVVDESNLLVTSNKTSRDVIKLITYTDI